MSSCGLDFGTSNTTLGRIVDHAPVLVPLEGGHTTIPSAIFFERNGGVLIGRRAIDTYVEGATGRLMRSLKSVLGTSLVDETTQVGRERRKFRDVIAYYVGAVKRRAEQAAGVEFRNVVHGRPVHFVDNAPDADARAETTLREIARGIGFHEITFQFEPIAAALDYERQIAHEEIALIADIGGGTSDFSIVRLSPQRHRAADRADDILANDGVRIGGTDFDRRVSLGKVMPLFGYGSAMTRAGLNAPTSYFHDLATWSNINRMYERGVAQDIRHVRKEAKQPELFDRLLRVLEEQRGHTLAMDVETSKIALSDAPRAGFSLDWVEPGLSVDVARADLVQHTSELADGIAARIARCLTQAGLAADVIDAVFLTAARFSLRMCAARSWPACRMRAWSKATPSALSARASRSRQSGAMGRWRWGEGSRCYGDRPTRRWSVSAFRRIVLAFQRDREHAEPISIMRCRIRSFRAGEHRKPDNCLRPARHQWRILPGRHMRQDRRSPRDEYKSLFESELRSWRSGRAGEVNLGKDLLRATCRINA